MEHLQFASAILCGALVGFILGLIGGGGSIMATPLLLYIVGLQPHVAIGTGALAVSVNAFSNFAGHARTGNVHWRGAVSFSVLGVAGATIGSSPGKDVRRPAVAVSVGILMMVVGVFILRRGAQRDSASSGYGDRLTGAALAKIALAALLVGVLAGFFGIGGGFLIVPGLLFSTVYANDLRGRIITSCGWKFALTTAINYAASGLVDWPVAAEFIGGGTVGGLLGMRLCVYLSPRKAALNRVFAGFVFVAAAYMFYRNIGALSGF